MTYSGTASHEPRRHACGGRSWREGGFGGRCRAPWTVAEVLAMILGFIVFWPIGLAVLGWKFWQGKTGSGGDFTTRVRENMARAGGFARRWEGPFAGGSAPRRWGARPSGNTAFDEWRTAELDRLEEERRKLEAAERDFTDYIANLRRARDREEFDRFMNERRGANRSEGGSQS